MKATIYTWYENTTGEEYVNIDRAERITISGTDPTRRINVVVPGASVQLKGDYVTLDAAKQAVMKLVDAIDPTIITGV